GSQDKPKEDASLHEPEVAEAKPLPRQGEIPQQWLTLGSLDPDGDYRMLVVLTNRGAAIERVALSSRRYYNLEDRSGYLGPLVVEDVPGGGCRVRVVGAGTPADRAGLRVGDVLQELDGKSIESADQLRKRLRQTRAGQQVSLAVQRDGTPLPDVTATLRRRPLEVMRPEVENMRLRNIVIPPEFRDTPSLLLTLQQLGETKLKQDDSQLPGIDLYASQWEVVEQTETTVAFRKVLPRASLEIIKRYTLEKVPTDSKSDPTFPGYGLLFDLEIRNRGDAAQRVAYRLDGPTGLPIEGWWYANKIGRSWGGVGLRDMVVRFENGEPDLFSCQSIADGKVEPLGQGSSLMFAGVDAQYFAAVLIPEKQQLGDLWFDETRAVRVHPMPMPKEDKRLTDVTCRLVSRPVTLEAGGPPLHHHFTLFSGPKMPQLLARYGQPSDMRYDLKGLVYYGWFGWVAKPMLAVLHTFYHVVRNYGLAIILLTVLVRGGMFPLSLKQTRNMQKMQQLQPEIKRIAEKYKSDMEKRTKAQQELFRKNSYNPMGGCLLMFVQLPIFIGLYRSLMVDVELRQAPLLGESIRWCSNLAAPDMFYDWSASVPDFISSGHGLFGLGPYLNILPLVTCGLFIVQQKMFMPPPADEQAEMQQKIMKYMMIFMGIMFFKVASGLCLYFIASTLWGITERKLLPKTPVGPDTPTEPAKQRSREPRSSNGNPRSGKKKRSK
ncbi:MAG: YidC/Oxa1 family insertase periplasmic-domain containing protein, partial [Pirellulales bacterium]